MADNTKTYHIASIPGDGIGVEVTEQAIRVLKRVQELFGTFALEFQHFGWSSESYRQTGEYIPVGGLETLKTYDAILFGAVGSPGVYLSFDNHGRSK